MVVIIPKELSTETIKHLTEFGEKAWLIGEIIPSTGEQVIIK